MWKPGRPLPNQPLLRPLPKLQRQSLQQQLRKLPPQRLVKPSLPAWPLPTVLLQPQVQRVPPQLLQPQPAKLRQMPKWLTWQRRQLLPQLQQPLQPMQQQRPRLR
jgi:hypothetical protein